MTRFADMNSAWQLVDELRDLRGLRDLQAADIQKMTITLDTTQGQKVITLQPGDQGWNGLLQTLNTMVTNKVNAIKTQLQGLSVTELPT